MGTKPGESLNKVLTALKRGSLISTEIAARLGVNYVKVAQKAAADGYLRVEDVSAEFGGEKRKTYRFQITPAGLKIWKEINAGRR